MPMTLAVLTPFIMTIIQILDLYRRYFFIDDGGDPNLYVPIKNFAEFVIIALQSAPYFLIKPLPWEADSLIQFVQSLENIFLCAFLAYIFIKIFKFDREIALKWFIFLIAAFSIYGLTVFNFGTAARYKFPFVVIIIVGASYELYLKHGQFILNKRIKKKKYTN